MPGSNRDVESFVAGQVEGGQRDVRVLEDLPSLVVVSVFGVECRKQRAGIEQESGHGSGRVRLTCSATLPPCAEASPRREAIADPRAARRSRRARSAKSRMTPLRVLPLRRASASTSARRSSGRETITFAIVRVYPGIPSGSRSELMRNLSLPSPLAQSRPIRTLPRDFRSMDLVSGKVGLVGAAFGGS